MKRKLFLLLCALLTMVGAQKVKAYTVSDLTTAGWTKINSINQNEVLNNYYIFLSEDESLMLTLEPSSNQGNNAAFFRPLADPAANEARIWRLEKNGANYSMRNVGTSILQMQTESSGTNNDLRWRTNDQKFPIEWTGLSLTYSSDYWTLTSTKYNRPLGIYDNVTGTPTDGNEVGANDSGKGQKFNIYAIGRAKYSTTYAPSASEAKPVNVSSYISNPEIYGNSNKENMPSGWSEDTSIRSAGNKNRTAAANDMTWLEGWTASTSSNSLKVKYYQTIESVPNGKYFLKAIAGDSNGSGGGKIYISNGTNDETASMSTGDADISTGKVLITNETITIGMTAQGKNSWVHATNFRLYYCGNAISYYSPTTFDGDDEATKDTWYAFTVSATGWYRISSTVEATIYYSQNASEDADNTASKAFTAGGYAFQNLAVGTYYFKSSATSTIKIEAVSSETLQNGDVVTDVFIANPSFEDSDMSRWNLGDGSYFGRLNGSDLEEKDGDYYAGTNFLKINRSISQNLSGLPSGNYILQVRAKAKNYNATSVNASVGMGGNSTPVLFDVEDSYTVAYNAVADNSSASIRFGGQFLDSKYGYFFCDNFTLTYYETLPDVSITDLTSSAMAADVRAALTSASSTYNSSKTVANYNALQTAIVNAKVSIAEYAAKTGADADWTDIIVNPAFTSNSSTGWTITGTSGNRQYGSSCAEAWNNNNVQYSQEIKYLPAGTYKLTAQVDNGRDNSNVSLFATCNSTTYSAAAPYRAISSYSATATALAGDANLCLTTIYLTVEEDEDLTIGVKDVSTGTGWMIFDSFKLTYNPTLPDELTAATGKMNSTVESTQTEKIAAYTGEKNISNLLDAQSAIYAAHQSVDVYKEITSIKNTYDTKAESLDEAGQSAYTTATTAVSGATTKYTAGEYTTSAQAETAYNADYITAVKAQGAGADLSDLITNSELFGKEYFDTETGTKSQTISGLANGYYLVKAQVFYRAGDKGSTSTDKNVKLFAASDGVTKYVFVQNINNYKGFASAQSTGTWKQVSSSFYVPDNTTAANYVFNTTNIYHNSVVIEVTNQSLELGINKIARTNRYDWAYWDNFQLQYLGASLPASLTAATGKMNSDVAAAQTTAVNAYNETSGQTVDNYNTAANAVILAEENKLMYTEINSAITGAAEKYQISSLNEAGQTEWAAQITHIEEKYNNGTYETFVAAQNDLSDARLAALTAQGGGSDWTTVIVNPSFEDGKTGWSVNYGSSTSHNSDEIQGGAGSRYFKSWRNTSDGGYVYQTINLPAGYYRLSVMIGAHQATNAKRFVKAGTTVQKDDVHHDYTRERLFVDFELSTAGNIEISAGCENSDEYHADDFLLTYLGNATATMQVSGTAKMGTFCAPFDVAIPDGVTAYEASMSSDEWVHLEEIEGGVIGAGTPVILSITADVTFSQTCYGVNTAENPDDRGVLKGLYEAETKLSGEHPYYIMQYYDNKTAFFRVPTGQSRNLGANRCYLQPESNLTPARIAIDGDDDDFTAINELKVIEAEAKTMKDGKYLVKGRIVIVKNGKAFDANGQKLN